MDLLIILLLVTVVVLRYGPLRDRRFRSIRVVLPGLIVGAIGFLLGFVGPILLTPEANQGPLLGIFITGPLGVVLGLLWGIWREWRRGEG
jgi:uncharacterized YccA/Bax inhibitor family protein